MGIQIIFLVIYFVSALALPAETMGIVLIVHCSINLLNDLREKKGVYVMTSFYAGVIISAIANVSFINKVRKYGITEEMMYAYIDMRYINDAMLLVCVGNTLIFIGYEFFSKRSFASIQVDIKNKDHLKYIFWFIMLMLTMRFTGHELNIGFLGGGASTVLSLLGAAGILFFARIAAKENSRKYYAYAIVICVFETIVALYTSFLRSDLVTPMIMFYAGYFIGKGSIKHVFSFQTIPAVVVLVVFSTFFQDFGGSRAHFVDAIVINPYYNNNFSYSIQQEDMSQRGGAFERVSNMAQITNIVRLTRQNGFYNGRASEPLVAAIIPRAIWPDKPTVQLGAWFALEIGGASRGENGRINNSINMTTPGELYLDFGYPGVILGCFLFGGMIALFWNAGRFGNSAYNLTGVLWGGYLLLYAFGGMGSDLQIVISLFSAYFVFYLIKRVALVYENTGSRTAMARK